MYCLFIDKRYKLSYFWWVLDLDMVRLILKHPLNGIGNINSNSVPRGREKSLSHEHTKPVEGKGKG